MLALVFMDPLHLHIEQRGVIHQDSQLLLDVPRQALLGLRFHLLPALPHARIVEVGFQLLQHLQIAAPTLTDRLIQQRREPRIGHGQPAAWGHPVGHVGEAIRPQPGEIRQHVLPEQLTVQFGHPVGVMAAHHRQMGHAHLALGALLDQ